MRPTSLLRARLAQPEILVAPGAYDALTAKLVEHAGFEAVYLTGAGVAYTTLGTPDLGLVTFTEMVERCARMAEATALPIVADADNGYGNALNVMRTVRGYERAGVAALQLEDQVLPKKCGHLAGKRLITMEAMVGKLRAALDARTDPDLLVVARTDARSVSGLPEAIERAQAYAEAGADVIFVESPQSEEELERVAAAIDKPLLANMVEGGRTPTLPAERLQAMGYRLVIYPGALVRFVARQLTAFLTDLRSTGTTNHRRDDMLSFTELQELLGLDTYRQLEAHYEAPEG